MKASCCAFAAMLSCAFVANSAFGQTLKHPTSIRPVSLSNDSYYGYYYGDEEPASPSDAAAEPTPAEPQAAEPQSAAPAQSSCSSCDPYSSRVYCDGCDGSGSSGCDSCYLFGGSEPFKLFPDAKCGVTAGFWTQIGYFTEGTNHVGTGLMNSYPNNLQLQQQWAYLEKTVDTGGCGVDWGFRIDYAYGTDGPDTQAFGGQLNDWDYGWWNGPDNNGYGSAIPQVYAELGVNNLKARLGHFYTIMGYEVVPATGNFFYSHSFEFYISEPFTHTGALLDYQLADDITLTGGWTAGWDTGFTANGGSCFIGGVKLQLTEKAALSYMTSWGDAGFDDAAGNPGSDSNGYFHTILFTWDINDNWSYVCQSNFVDNDLLLGSTLDTITWNNYLFYTINDCWKVGARFEYFKDPRIPVDRVATNANSEVYDFTVGVNYKPMANVVVRPELRWDDYNQNSGLRDTFLFGIDTVITY